MKLLISVLLVLVFVSASADPLPEPSPTSEYTINKPHLRFNPRKSHIRLERAKFRESSPEKSRGGDVELGGSNESSVAVSPLDPMIVAYASCLELRVSTDGGATFGPSVFAPFPTTHSLAGDPVVVFDTEGRLFWEFLGWLETGNGIDIFLAQCDPSTGEILPGYPVNVTALALAPGANGYFSDKPWMAIDTNEGSPFENNIYMAWTVFGGDNLVAYCRSEDQGQTWSEAEMMVDTYEERFAWPTHLAVANNGDVYCAHHIYEYVDIYNSSRIQLTRSVDGGLTYERVGDPYPSGMAYLGENIQSDGHFHSPGTDFWFQGSFQPWILTDPHNSANLSVVACADSDGPLGHGDDGNIYIVHSTDNGQTWSDRQRVDSDIGESLQVFPTATRDPENGNIAVTWYDTREGHLNGDNNFLLNTYATVSFDGGLNFLPDFRIDDEPFDPDAGAPCRFDCGIDYVSCSVSAAGHAYACSGTDVFHWDGISWSEMNPGGYQAKNGVWSAYEDAVWVVEPYGFIRFYDGNEWVLQFSGVNSHLYSISGRSTDDVFAVGKNGIVVHWDGASWTEEDSGTDEVLWSVCAVPGGAVWAVGEAGTVIRNSGSGWETLPPINPDELPGGIFAFADGQAWVAGLFGGIYHWDAEQWNTLDSETVYLSSVWGASTDDIYFGGLEKMLHWDGSALSTIPLSGIFTSAVSGNSESNIFTVGRASKIFQFDGSSWQFLDNPGVVENPTLRIGEYNGVAASGVVAVTTWTGNISFDQDEPVNQQSMFDTFPLDPSLVSVPIEEASSMVFLEPGQPNPFRWVTNFSYSLPQSQAVTCGVYDVRGHLVRQLHSGGKTEGRHTLTWDGRDGTGNTVSGGVYFLKLETGGEMEVRKLTLVR